MTLQTNERIYRNAEQFTEWARLGGGAWLSRRVHERSANTVALGDDGITECQKVYDERIKDTTETIYDFDICDVFKGFGSPALHWGHEIPAERRNEILSAEGLPPEAEIAVVYDRSFPGVGKGAHREDVDEDRCAALPGWFALLDCGAVVPDRVCRGNGDGEYGEDAAPEDHPVFIPW